MDDEQWTLGELAAEVEAALGDVAPANGQVRAVPDERGLRYYTTLGLLDRPAAMRGRTALYGRRHLAQVVAIKRLQAAGRSLAEIQQIVPVLGDEALAQMSGVAVPSRRRAASRAGFWRQPPAAAATAEVAAASAPHGSPRGAARRDADVPAARLVPQIALTLAPGVVLTLDAARAPGDVDAEALLAAAAPLLAELRRRRLIDDRDFTTDGAGRADNDHEGG